MNSALRRATGIITRRLRASTVFLAAALLVLTASGFGCKTVSKEVTDRTKPLTLKVWCVFDDTDAYGAAFTAYQTAHPNVSFDYRKLNYDEYEHELLNALSEDRGPDIFCLHNTWMREWQPRLLPVPPALSIVKREIKGAIKKEAVYSIVQVPGMSVKQLQNDFVDAVADDAVLMTEQDDPRLPAVPRVYGLPLSVDTLTMYFNRDILNAAGVAQPAADWREFQDQVKKVTKLDELGTIVQSAAAIGTSANVERSADILALLMTQNGTVMFSDAGAAAFDQYTAETAGQPLPPGAVALVFYDDFANPEKEVYTWNAKMPGSFDAFINGRTAYFFGYAYHLPQIRLANAKLNFGIAAFPQIQGNQPVNLANYWLYSVSKKTAYANEAWDLVQFMTKSDQAQTYLTKTKKPTALRSLVNSQLEDLDLSVFAAQVTSARSWYRGSDASAAETAFTAMIDQMLAGETDPKRIVELGAAKVNQTVE